MTLIPYIILFIVIFLSLARADNYEREFVVKEKAFQEYEQKKTNQEKHKADGLQAWLRRREYLEEKKRKDLHEWLEKKRGNRAPAAESLEDADDRKREAWRQKNEENKHRYVQSVIAKEEARQKVMKEFDSKELRLRENKPWR